MRRMTLVVLLFMLPAAAHSQGWRNVATNVKQSGYELHPIGDFHGGEATVADGSEWLALQCNVRCSLVPVRAEVNVIFDPIIDGDDARTGESIRARGVDDALFLLRGRRFSPGPVAVAQVEEVTGTAGDEEAPVLTRLTLDKSALLLRRLVESGSHPARVRIVSESNGRTQLLAESDSTDLAGYILWSGDLDRDGEVDLIVDLSDHYNISLPTLLLSSERSEANPLGAVAAHLSSGC